MKARAPRKAAAAVARGMNIRTGARSVPGSAALVEFTKSSASPARKGVAVTVTGAGLGAGVTVRGTARKHKWKRRKKGSCLVVVIGLILVDELTAESGFWSTQNQPQKHERGRRTTGG